MPGEVSAAAVQLASAHSPAAESDTSSQFPPDHPLRVHPKMLGELSRHLTKDELTEELSNRSKSGPLSADAAVDINKRAAKSRYGDRTSVKARAKAATAALGAHYSADARQKQWVHHALKSKDWRVRLAVFCDEPSSSPQAFVFAVLVALMVLAQVFLIFFETGSFGASPNLDTTEKARAAAHVTARLPCDVPPRLLAGADRVWRLLHPRARDPHHVEDHVAPALPVDLLVRARTP